MLHEFFAYLTSTAYFGYWRQVVGKDAAHVEASNKLTSLVKELERYGKTIDWQPLWQLTKNEILLGKSLDEIIKSISHAAKESKATIKNSVVAVPAISTPTEAKDVGGIDLNARALRMNIQGDAIRIDIPGALPENISVDGFVPFITNITLISDIASLIDKKK